jgi:RNA polymerase sigma factor (sigma-70 family)
MKPLPFQAVDPLTTRYSLLSRLQDWKDQDSWKDFFDTYWRLIYSVALKAGLTEFEAQEVVQETVISVAKGIHRFQRDPAKGSFRGWLRNVTQWRIIDQLRKRRPGEAENYERDLSEIPEPGVSRLESLWDAEWEANIFEVAIERVKRRVKEEHYQIFDLHIVKRLPVTEVAATLGVSSAKVYLIKHRISALIKKEIRTLEARPF